MEFSAITAGGSLPTKRAYHSCSVIQGVVYIFGGITDDRTVLDDMYCFDLATGTWSQIEEKVPRSSPSKPLVSNYFPKGRLCIPPTVSHHTATVIRDRYIVIIGGWNGRKRTAEVYCFDTADQTWRHVPESGEVPVGLSSHTSCLVSSKSILIIGREGGVHTQRRFSGAFSLDFESGRYSTAPLNAASRSGHTTNIIRVRDSKDHYLFVFGGRKSGGYEFLGSSKKLEAPQCAISKDMIDQLLAQSTVCEEPSGRQYAQTVEMTQRHLLIYGGETWNGVRENVTNEIFILDSGTMTWCRVPVTEQVPRLVGHSMCGTGDRILVFGGSINNKCTNTLWDVKLCGTVLVNI